MSTVGKYTDGRRKDVRIPFSVLNNAKFCSSWHGRSFKNSLIDCNVIKLIYFITITFEYVPQHFHYLHLGISFSGFIRTYECCGHSFSQIFVLKLQNIAYHDK